MTGILPHSLNLKAPFPRSLAIGLGFFCRNFHLFMLHSSATVATQSRKKWEKPALFLAFFNLQGLPFPVFWPKRGGFSGRSSCLHLLHRSNLWAYSGEKRKNPKAYPQMGPVFKFGCAPQFTCYSLSFRVRELLFAF